MARGCSLLTSCDTVKSLLQLNEIVNILTNHMPTARVAEFCVGVDNQAIGPGDTCLPGPPARKLRATGQRRIRRYRNKHYPMTNPLKLIFLPGAGGNPSFWQPVSDRMVHSASRVLLGWPGCGAIASDPKVKGLQDLVELVVAEIDQPSALIAQSMGGIVAIQAALKRTDLVTHLVLAATSGGVDFSDLQVEDWRPDFFSANPNHPRWFVDFKKDISSDIARVRAPALLLWGDSDPISPLAVGTRLKGLLNNSKMHVFHGGEHDLANKLAAECAPLIDEYLKNSA